MCAFACQASDSIIITQIEYHCAHHIHRLARANQVLAADDTYLRKIEPPKIPKLNATFILLSH